MKKLKYLVAIMAMIVSVSLVSCNNDDAPTPETPEHPIADPSPIQPLPEDPVVNPM